MFLVIFEFFYNVFKHFQTQISPNPNIFKTPPGSVAFGIEINSIDHPDTEFRVKGSKAFEHPKHSPAMFQIFVTFKSLARKFRVCAIDRDIEEFFTRIVSETIEHREKNKVTRNDFMNLMIQLKNFGKLEGDVTDIGRLSLDEIVAQSFIFFAAGYETSSTTISHT
jgi:cytochrome P450 family 6